MVVLGAQEIGNLDKISHTSHLYKRCKSTFNKGCVLCEGDIMGDNVMNYRCVHCNVVYTEEDLKIKIPKFIKEEGIRKFR